jgi:hypothetical protein
MMACNICVIVVFAFSEMQVNYTAKNEPQRFPMIHSRLGYFYTSSGKEKTSRTNKNEGHERVS